MFETRAKFFVEFTKAQCDEGSGRIMLGDNTEIRAINWIQLDSVVCIIRHMCIKFLLVQHWTSLGFVTPPPLLPNLKCKLSITSVM